MKLLETNDWDKFCIFKENRNSISGAKYNNLKSSIAVSTYLICPILVIPIKEEDSKNLGTLESFADDNGNSRWEDKPFKEGLLGIIDGQHRLRICRDLGMTPIIFINEKASRKDVVLANNSANPWKITDYIKYYYELYEAGDSKYRDYDVLLTLMKGEKQEDEYGAPTKDLRCVGGFKRTGNGLESDDFNVATIVDAYFGGEATWNGSYSSPVKLGDYTVNKIKGNKIIKTIKRIIDVSNCSLKPSKLNRGIIGLYTKVNNYDCDLLINYIKTNDIKINTELSKKDVIEYITSIYLIAVDENNGNGMKRDFSDKQFDIAKSFYGNECYVKGCDNISKLQPDHHYPWDGNHDNTLVDNCRPLCEHHNKSKGNKSPEEFYKHD